MSNRSVNRQQRKIPESDTKSIGRPSQNSPPNQNIPVSPSLGKLSISDAIGLITIRLSKVEENMLRNNNTNATTTDIATLTRSLATRVNALENCMNDTSEEVEQGNPEESEDPNSWVAKREQIFTDLATFKADLDDIRKLVIKIQTSLA